MTIQGAMNELINLLNADDIPIYYKSCIKKVIETIDDYIGGGDDYVKRRTDRKTEPQYSEDDMYWLSLAEDVANGKMSDAGANQAWLEYINRKSEPTISKMEQVDKDINVRSKDEPQTERSE